MTAQDTNEKDEDRPKSWKRIKNLFSNAPQSTQEVVAIVESASENAIIDTDAKRIIEGALEVSEMQARDIMVPRTQMMLLKASDPLQVNLQKIISSGHSRYPVIGESNEDVLGILLSKDLLGPLSAIDHCKSDGAEPETIESIDILSLIRPPVFVPESKRLNLLLKQFRQNRNHLALVVDEYGSLAGLVTIEDVLEEIVGEIEDEHDDIADRHIRRVTDNHFVINAATPIDEFNEFFITQVDTEAFETIGGFVSNLFGHLPKRNESIQYLNYTFEVIQADSRRVRLFRLTKHSNSEASNG